MNAGLLFFSIAYTALIGISCSRCGEDELWRERVEFPDGSHIMIYHSNTCRKEKPFFCPTEKIMDYVQMKTDVLDFCLSDRDAELLFSISIRNIEKRRDNFLPLDDADFEHYERFMNVIDTLYHPYECYYALKDHNVIPLEDSFIP